MNIVKKLPKWAWIVIIGGGVVVGLILRNRKQATQQDAQTATDTSATDGTSGMFPPYVDPNTGDIIDPNTGNTIGNVGPSATPNVDGSIYSPDESGILANQGSSGGPSVLVLPSTTPSTGGGPPATPSPDFAHMISTEKKKRHDADIKLQKEIATLEHGSKTTHKKKHHHTKKSSFK